MLATPVEVWCLETTPPQAASKPKTNTLLLKRLLVACFSLLLRQVYHIFGRWSINKCDSSECDSSDSSDPPFCAVRPYYTHRPYYTACYGGSGSLTLDFLQFFRHRRLAASLTSKLSSNVTVLGSVVLRANEVPCLPSTWWDMEYFHTHSIQGCEISTAGVRWCGMVCVCR